MSGGSSMAKRKGDANPIVMASKGLIIALKLLFVLMRLKRKAKSAGRRFRKAAIKGGMDKALARQLSEDYVAFTSVRKLMKTAMGSRSLLG